MAVHLRQRLIQQPTDCWILGLPTELLSKIAHGVAPLGGRKAGALRLVCGAFADVAKPITWASLLIPGDDIIAPQLCDELKLGRAKYTRSIRYDLPTPHYQDPDVAVAIRRVPNLERLHLFGRSRDTYPSPGLLQDFDKLEELILDGLNLSKVALLHGWAKGLRSLSVIQCEGVSSLTRSPATPPPNPRRRNRNPTLPHLAVPVTPHPGVRRLLISDCSPHAAATSSFVGSVLTFPGAREYVIDGNIKFSNAADEYMRANPLDERKTPFSVELQGNRRLDYMVPVLNWVGTGPLTTLTLPVSPGPPSLFATSTTALQHLSLPKLNKLTLAVVTQPKKLVNKRPVFYMVYDLISTDLVSQGHLITFLNLIDLSTLSILCLRGWADYSGVSTISLPPPAPVVPALPPQEGSSPSDAPDVDDSKVETPFIVKLLALLRTMGVRKLRLENSVDHPDAGTRCVFSRKGDADWVSEIVIS